jgi:hypothetical protein
VSTKCALLKIGVATLESSKNLLLIAKKKRKNKYDAADR